MGMTLPEVEEVLGKKWKELPSIGTVKTYVFSDGPKSITVVIDNGRVTDKSSGGLD